MKFSQVFQVAFMAATVAAAPAATSGLAKRSADLDEAIVIKILTAYGDVKPSAGGEYPHLHPSSNKITLGTGQRYDSKEVEELIRLVLDEAHSQYSKA
ncbi:hypothetical protein CKAH01_11425 [Colletotrichum kahawae]|uniref:Uncharacterized protein n=1 Tax=Colletotrichum kahawae TaxID=34407 RepID=A0AAE0DGG0_COLKA|nr:hypothetical protein CKAH01_11425 [Colletotrichum kahawae]